MSGKGVLPIALKCIREVRAVSDLPIIGCGGVSSADDVRAFFHRHYRPDNAILAVAGAEPRYLSLNAFIEEGLQVALPAWLVSKVVLKADAVANPVSMRPVRPYPMGLSTHSLILKSFSSQLPLTV